MPHKITPNGFGRLGKTKDLMLLAQMLPYMPAKPKRLINDGFDSLQEAIDDTGDRMCMPLIYAPDDIVKLKNAIDDSCKTDITVDTSDLPKGRYHDRIFPKDYHKQKKAKRRQQKKSRRRN